MGRNALWLQLDTIPADSDAMFLLPHFRSKFVLKLKFSTKRAVRVSTDSVSCLCRCSRSRGHEEHVSH